MSRPLNPLAKAAIFLGAFYLGLKLILPAIAAWLAAKSWFDMRWGLTTSGKEVNIYFTLASLATFAWASYSEERWQEFKRPIVELLASGGTRRTIALVAFPLVLGILAFWNMTAGVGASSFVPLRHPTPPDQFSKLKNPYRHPTSAMLDAFEAQAREGKLEAGDTTEDAVRAWLTALKAGNATPEQRSAAFERRAIEEGRILFVQNCRPCHGTKAMGDGPMARGLRREPADFTGVETIATLVEGAVFWRVKTGGIGLPHAGGPWESAMPPWGEEDLTDDQIWKIIMAEYDIAGNKPREPEKLE